MTKDWSFLVQTAQNFYKITTLPKHSDPPDIQPQALWCGWYPRNDHPISLFSIQKSLCVRSCAPRPRPQVQAPANSRASRREVRSAHSHLLRQPTDEILKQPSSLALVRPKHSLSPLFRIPLWERVEKGEVQVQRHPHSLWHTGWPLDCGEIQSSVWTQSPHLHLKMIPLPAPRVFAQSTQESQWLFLKLDGALGIASRPVTRKLELGSEPFSEVTGPEPQCPAQPNNRAWPQDRVLIREWFHSPWISRKHSIFVSISDFPLPPQGKVGILWGTGDPISRDLPCRHWGSLGHLLGMVRAPTPHSEWRGNPSPNSSDLGSSQCRTGADSYF